MSLRVVMCDGYRVIMLCCIGLNCVMLSVVVLCCSVGCCVMGCTDAFCFAVMYCVWWWLIVYRIVFYVDCYVMLRVLCFAV